MDEQPPNPHLQRPLPAEPVAGDVSAGVPETDDSYFRPNASDGVILVAIVALVIIALFSSKHGIAAAIVAQLTRKRRP